jgi:hypothetical protein
LLLTGLSGEAAGVKEIRRQGVGGKLGILSEAHQGENQIAFHFFTELAMSLGLGIL